MQDFFSCVRKVQMHLGCVDPLPCVGVHDPLYHPEGMFMRLQGILFTLALMAWVMTPAGADAFAWHTATPASQGMSAAKLQKLQDDLQRRQTKTLLVIRNDQIVWEWYAPDYDPTTPHYTASMAKALVGGMAAAIAISDGRLDLDDRAAHYVRQWRADARKSRITVRQLGSHTSGLADAEADDLSHAERRELCPQAPHHFRARQREQHIDLRAWRIGGLELAAKSDTAFAC